MKGFRFPLEAVLTLREEHEQDAQRGLARALAEVGRIQGDLAVLDGRVDALSQEIKEHLARGVAAADLEHFGAFGSVLAERKVRLEQDLAMADAAVREARGRLLKATQDRQTLENYRGKLRRRFDYRQSVAEQKMLDDLAGRQPVLDSGRAGTSSAFAP